MEKQASTVAIHAENSTFCPSSSWLLKLTWLNNQEVKLAQGERLTKLPQRGAVSTVPSHSIFITPKLQDSQALFQVTGFYSCCEAHTPTGKTGQERNTFVFCWLHGCQCGRLQRTHKGFGVRFMPESWLRPSVAV